MYLRAKLEELLDLNEAALEALEAEMDEPSTLESQLIFGELAVLPLDSIRDGLSLDESDRS